MFDEGDKKFAAESMKDTWAELQWAYSTCQKQTWKFGACESHLLYNLHKARARTWFLNLSEVKVKHRVQSVSFRVNMEHFFRTKNHMATSAEPSALQVLLWGWGIIFTSLFQLTHYILWGDITVMFSHIYIFLLPFVALVLRIFWPLNECNTQQLHFLLTL